MPNRHHEGVINMRRSLISIGLAALCVLIWPATALAATDPDLGTAGNYAVVAGSTITNTGGTWITGKLALAPGTAITGFPGAWGATSGAQDVANPAATQAQTDFGGANPPAAISGPSTFTRGMGQTPCTTTGVNLGGQTLAPGIYCNGTMGITGGQTLTLTGGGVYLFQIVSTPYRTTAQRPTPGARRCDFGHQPHHPARRMRGRLHEKLSHPDIRSPAARNAVAGHARCALGAARIIPLAARDRSRRHVRRNRTGREHSKAPPPHLVGARVGLEQCSGSGRHGPLPACRHRCWVK